MLADSLPGEGREHLQAHVTLGDGSVVSIDKFPRLMPLASWLPYVLALRPLRRLANAAEALDPGRDAGRLEEGGPHEVAHAARAFNAIHDRIAHYLQERVQILPAISHDLQTPITRMKLRAEMTQDSPEKDKLVADLSKIERLVREGVAYARSAHCNQEKPVRIDLGSFVDSLAFNYQDTGKPVRVVDPVDCVVTIRPHALRRILTNLVDNALKFGGEAQIEVFRGTDGIVSIAVLDGGPGSPRTKSTR